MFRTGHYGAALAVYAPFGAWLLSLGHPGAAVVGGAGAVWLTMLPDWDHRVSFVSHRGPTHTLAFAGLLGVGAWVAVGVAMAGLGGSASGTNLASLALGFGAPAIGPLSLRAFAASVVALSVLAHLSADLLTPMGVPLLWPVTDRRYSLSVTTADSAAWNYALFVVGVFATGAAGYLGLELLARGGI
ncbi:metal-dependent hydrolase [Halorussus lipolyticus]|uniref:metal-dependent hydrolase n=1 Tax=Halorussus lipolyticus TaxID=3034024 RepID=UPI0023E8E79D|nr:metal-dependent hydrolase [Halorussus sp. DT80]